MEHAGPRALRGVRRSCRASRKSGLADSFQDGTYRDVSRPSALFERQVVVARPLVPGAGVVACAVPGVAQGHGREGGARSRMAVRDDLGRIPEPSPDLIRGQRFAGAGVELVHGDVTCARDATLPRVARITVLPPELLLRSNIEDHQRRVVESAGQLVACGNRLEARLER